MLVAQVCRRDEANPKSLSRSWILRSFAGGRTHKQWSHQQRPRRSKAIWVPLLLHQRCRFTLQYGTPGDLREFGHFKWDLRARGLD